MAKTANEKLFDQQVRFNVDLQRYSTRLVKLFISILNKTDADLLSQIDKAQPEKLDSFTNRRKEQLLANIRDLNAQAYKRAGKKLTPELKALAVSQAGLAAKAINSAVGVELKIAAPSPALLEAVVTAQPFQGKIMSDWFNDLSDGRFKRMRDAINIGILEGETTDQIITRIRGSSANSFRDGILDISRRDADAVVRTAVNHTVTRSREALYEQNADLIKGVQWVSTLDSRTTPICRARDGKVYKPGEGPRPPAHVRCLPASSLITASPGIAGAFKRRYDGNLVVIGTAGGKQLACTPNHPVLTDRGWVRALKASISATTWSATAAVIGWRRLSTAMQRECASPH
jgi:SPP1 gp7 family putative phage head morphogenesis protein